MDGRRFLELERHGVVVTVFIRKRKVDHLMHGALRQEALVQAPDLVKRRVRRWHDPSAQFHVMDVAIGKRQHSFAGTENHGVTIQHQRSFVTRRHTSNVPDDIYRRSASRASQRCHGSQ